MRHDADIQLNDAAQNTSSISIGRFFIGAMAESNGGMQGRTRESTNCRSTSALPWLEPEPTRHCRAMAAGTSSPGFVMARPAADLRVQNAATGDACTAVSARAGKPRRSDSPRRHQASKGFGQ